MCLPLISPILHTKTSLSSKCPEIQLTGDSNFHPQCFLSAHPWNLEGVHEMNLEVRLGLPDSQNAVLRFSVRMTTLSHHSTGKGVSLWASFSPSLVIFQEPRAQPPQVYSQCTHNSQVWPQKSRENRQSSQTLTWLEMLRLSMIHSSTLQGQNVVAE